MRIKSLKLFLLLVIASLAARGSLRATSFTQNISAPCASAGSTINVDFEGMSDWPGGPYAYMIGFSNDTTYNCSDTWSTGSTLVTATSWQAITRSVTIPAGFSSGFLVIVARDGSVACNSYQTSQAIPYSTTCGTPTPTVTATATGTPLPTLTFTPVMPIVKSVSPAVASLGDTVTFCLDWTNDSSGLVTINLGDTIAPEFNYLGCDTGCLVAGSTVSWNIPAAAGATGRVCFWAEITGLP